MSEPAEESLPSVLSEAYAALVSERRAALQARQLRLARLFAQDLSLWFASMGTVALLMAGLLKVALLPIWPSSVRTTALVVLMVTLAITIFTMAAAAPNMRTWFRAEAARRQALADRLSKGSHAAATELLTAPGHSATVLLLDLPEPAHQLGHELVDPVGVGYLPRTGAVGVGPASRHDPFPEARVAPGPPPPGQGPELEPVVHGVLDGLDLLGSPRPTLADHLPEEARLLGLCVLDQVQQWPRSDLPIPRVDVLAPVLEPVLTELLAHVRGVALELPREDTRAVRLLDRLGRLGPRLLVLTPPGEARGRFVAEALAAQGHKGVCVAERSSLALERGVRRWWAGLEQQGPVETRPRRDETP